MSRHLMSIREAFDRSPYFSMKHRSYFQAYDLLLAPYRDREIVFVEVGVLNGGSLFMWREFLGPKARIVGVDFNPGARKWEASGFEIHIGNQADPAFWRDFFRKVGPVDILLDDGGHTNEQQIVTTSESFAHIRDGGLIIVEDAHASYLREFGNPYKYSFMNYAKSIVDVVNGRFHTLKERGATWSDCVFYVSFFESIVCFHIDRSRSFVNAPVVNAGVTSEAVDFRDADLKSAMLDRLGPLRSVALALRDYAPVRNAMRAVLAWRIRQAGRLRARRLKDLFGRTGPHDGDART